MIENVTGKMNDALAQHDDIRNALGIIAANPIFGRETRSAALGEISEHLVARIVSGERRQHGNKGYDVVDTHGMKIEVKSRLTGRWGGGLMFDFGRHTKDASQVVCVAWDDSSETTTIFEAYVMPVNYLILNWGCSQTSYCARTTLRKLRLACQQ